MVLFLPRKFIDGMFKYKNLSFAIVKNMQILSEEIKEIFLFSDDDEVFFVNFKSHLSLTRLLIEFLCFFICIFLIIKGFGRVNNIFQFLKYPAMGAFLFIWVRLISQESFSNLLLHNPSLPIKQHMWIITPTIGIILYFLIKIMVYYYYTTLVNFSFIPAGLYYVGSYIGIFAAPIVEEILFRGYFYIRLKNYASSHAWSRNKFLWYEIFISTLLFCLWHWQTPSKIVYALVFGFLVAVIRNEWGESLTIPIIIHILNNAVIFLW